MYWKTSANTQSKGRRKNNTLFQDETMLLRSRRRLPMGELQHGEPHRLVGAGTGLFAPCGSFEARAGVCGVLRALINKPAAAAAARRASAAARTPSEVLLSRGQHAPGERRRHL